MSSRWFKLHKKLGHSDIGDDVLMLGVWTRLLLDAQWRSRKVTIGGKQVKLGAGELSIKVTEFAKSIKMSRSKCRRVLKYFEETGRISTNRFNSGTVVTICNWEDYQAVKVAPDHAPTNGRPRTDHAPTTHRPTVDHPTSNTPTKNGELSTPLESIETVEGVESIETVEYKTGTFSATPLREDAECVSGDSPSDQDQPKKAAISNSESLGGQNGIRRPPTNSNGLESKSAAPKKPSKKVPKKYALPEDRSLAIQWAAWSKSNWPKIKTDIDSWAEEIAKVKRVAGISHELLAATWELARDDDFWSDKLQSPKALTKRMPNGNRKIENAIKGLAKDKIKEARIMAYCEARDRGDIPSVNEGFAF